MGNTSAETTAQLVARLEKSVYFRSFAKSEKRKQTNAAKLRMIQVWEYIKLHPGIMASDIRRELNLLDHEVKLCIRRLQALGLIDVNGKGGPRGTALCWKAFPERLNLPDRNASV